MSQRENISSEEVEKFNDLAREWWNPHGSFAPLHKLNPLRFEYIRENSSLEGKTAIDVGCGGGIHACQKLERKRQSKISPQTCNESSPIGSQNCNGL